MKYLLVLYLFFLSFHVNANDKKEIYEQLNLFGEAFEKIKNNYVEEVEVKELIEAAIEGMLSSLDPHSTYLNTEELDELKIQTKGEFGGLGIEVTVEDGFVKVIAPIDDTPASKAGIISGDLITHIDGESIFGMSLSDAVSLMRGRVGSKIKLTIRRKKNEIMNVEIIRDIIELKSVKYRLENDIGYIRLSSFNQKVDEEIKEAIKKIDKETNSAVLGYVLDLRNNPGGLLDQAVNVTDIFLSQGEIVTTRGRKKSDGSRFNAAKNDLINGLPLVVLINQGSASASEIVAGALQDHNRAIIMGTKSFGKGSVQTILPSGNDVAIKLTTARYYTPSGKSIQQTGIDPDILVEQSEIKSLEIDSSVRKESDLPKAIKNEQISKDKKSQDPKENEKSKSDDYQLSRALDLILALSISNDKN